MADIQFANIGNALLAGSQAAYNMGRSRRESEAERRRAEAQPFIEPAVRGDPGAFAKVAAGDPATAASVAQALARMDASTLAKAKAATDYAANATTAILSLPEGDRERMYQHTRTDAQTRGMDISRWPANYDPAWTQTQHAIGVGAKTWFEQNQQNQRHATPAGGAPTAVDLPGAGGAAPGLPPQGDDSSSGSPSGYRPPVGNTPAAGAISKLESGGRYGAIGPVANSKGNRAYGKYQVMDFNIGPWTQEFLGRSMTPQEFAANPEAQDRVFEGKFGQYVQKYGSPQAAARAWFGGESGMNNPNARDVNGMTVARYEGNFNNALGGSGGGNAFVPAQAGAPTSYGNPGPIAMPPSGAPASLSGQLPPFEYPGAAGVPPPQAPQARTSLSMPSLPVAGMPQGGDTQPQADGSGTPLPPAGAQTAPKQGQQLPVKAGFAEEDPTQYGYKQRGIRKNGIVTPQVIEGGYFVYRNPQTGAEVLYKPRAEVPPAGYRAAPGGALASIPGGPADPSVITQVAESKRIAAEKAIPQTVTKGMQENVNSLKQLDRVEAELAKVPDSVGGVGSTAASIIPGVGALQNRFGDPQGTQLRALIADIGSMKIHDRSGAAVTASEFPRLRPFIPTISDDAKTIRAKIANFRAEYTSLLADTASYYGPENGFRAYTPATDYLEGRAKGEPGTPAAKGPREQPAAPAPAPVAAPASKGSLKLPPKPGAVEEGYRFKGGDPGKQENWERAQ